MIGRDDQTVDPELCRELTPLDIVCYSQWGSILRVALPAPDPRWPMLEVVGPPAEAIAAYQSRHLREHLRAQREQRG